jgi:hypothetical protein
MSSTLTLGSMFSPLIEGNTVLDMTFGRGKCSYSLKAYQWSAKNGLGEEEPELLVCLNFFLLFLRKKKYHRIYDAVVHFDVTCITFWNGVFDIILRARTLNPGEQIERDMRNS